MSQPRHRRHEWSAIREYRVPKVEPRHAADRTRERLGAESPDVKALFEAPSQHTDYLRELMRDVFTVPQHIREMGRR